MSKIKFKSTFKQLYLSMVPSVSGSTFHFPKLLIVSLFLCHFCFGVSLIIFIFCCLKCYCFSYDIHLWLDYWKTSPITLISLWFLIFFIYSPYCFPSYLSRTLIYHDSIYLHLIQEAKLMLLMGHDPSIELESSNVFIV